MRQWDLSLLGLKVISFMISHATDGQGKGLGRMDICGTMVGKCTSRLLSSRLFRPIREVLHNLLNYPPP